LNDGKTVEGLAEGLEKVEVKLGGQAVTLDLSQAKALQVQTPGAVAALACTVVARRDAKEVGRFETRISLGGLVSEGALLDRIQAAIQAGRIVRTQQGGSGDNPYEDVPNGGALLTGLEVTYGKFGRSLTVNTFRPIFLTPTGRALGTTHGAAGA
ncbi:MAG TPA: hypothetical protein VNX28_07740, partial [Gemmataceae bacterium]|nr:hypothetical protein [Gemmataceae bacterium]